MTKQTNFILTEYILNILEIKSSSQVLSRMLLVFLYTTYPPNHCMVTSFNMWQISCWHGPCFITIQKHTSVTDLKYFPRFKSNIPLFASIDKSSRKAFQADWIQAVTASMHPPDCPMTSPRKQNSLTVSNSSPSIVMHVGKGLTNEILTMSEIFPDSRTSFMYPFLAT